MTAPQPSGTALLDALRKVCGEGHAVPATEADAVADIRPGCLVRPASTDETSEVMRVVAEHRARVVVRGSGTKLGWGSPPERCDLLLDTSRLSGVVEHTAGDLVAVVQAGTPLGRLQEHLAPHRQMLALDEPVPGSTVGGTVATATSGPRRHVYGTVRDLLIGITVVLADGTVARSGGKVVKNVAGYDLGKLYTGSYGTLGVVTECAFRLHPVPAARAVVTASVDAPDAVWRHVRALLHSPVTPAAIEVDRPDADGPATLGVLLEGVSDGVETRAADVAAMLGAGAVVSDGTPPWWGRYPWAAGGVGLRLTSRLSGLPVLLRATSESARAAGVPLSLRGSAGAGVLYAGLDGDVPAETLRRALASLRASAAAVEGTVVALQAPAHMAREVDLWGPVGGLTLMRRVKHQFDAERLLAPGRFVGGI